MAEVIQLICLRQPDRPYCQQYRYSNAELGSVGETLQVTALEPMALARELSVISSTSSSQPALWSNSPQLFSKSGSEHETKTSILLDNDDSDLLSVPQKNRETSTTRPKHPFDYIRVPERPDLMAKLHGTTSTSNGNRDDKSSGKNQVIPARSTEEEGFVEQETVVSTLAPPPPPLESNSQTGTDGLTRGTNPGFTIEDMFLLCQRFLPIAAEHCTKDPIEKQFVDRCQGYLADCAPFLVSSQQKPKSLLETIANAYSSGVGLTYYHWGVNGIPYYPINEEGSVSNGANGKIDYGSWGGGYSNNFGVRDFWTMNSDAGANWYEGLYGYKTGWHVPVVQSLGIEGGGGSQVHVPIKEGEFGKPLHATSGYFVGPYAGIAESTGIDWLNGRVTTQSGFASPYVGVNVNSGSSIGFPSIASVLRQLASNSKVLQFSANSVSSQKFSAPGIYDLLRAYST